MRFWGKVGGRRGGREREDSAERFVIGQGYEFLGSVSGVGGYPAGFEFVPEPSIFTLAALGALGLGSVRRRSAR